MPVGTPGTSCRMVARPRASVLAAESRNDGPPRSTVSGSMSSWPPSAVTVPVALRVMSRPRMVTCALDAGLAVAGVVDRDVLADLLRDGRERDRGVDVEPSAPAGPPARTARRTRWPPRRRGRPWPRRRPGCAARPRPSQVSSSARSAGCWATVADAGGRAGMPWRRRRWTPPPSRARTPARRGRGRGRRGSHRPRAGSSSRAQGLSRGWESAGHRLEQLTGLLGPAGGQVEERPEDADRPGRHHGRRPG